ncbi:MAG TPA: hypothetical protein VMQ11_14065 [Alphaproteobacteria bacterium]|nr:hypothetical protein [Alphaproteobacteria bacterium]
MDSLNSWTTRFVAGSLGGAVALVLLFLGFFGFRQLGLSLNGAIALTLGIVLSIGLAVGLMALIFYSNRSGRDETVGGEHYDRRG